MVRTNGSGLRRVDEESEGWLLRTSGDEVDRLEPSRVLEFKQIAMVLITVITLVALFFGRQPWEYILGAYGAPNKRSYLVSDQVSMETCASCVLTMFMACALLCCMFVYRWNGHSVDEEDRCKRDPANNEYSILLDNTRVLAQLLVIYSSFLSHCLSSEATDCRSWLKGSETVIGQLNELLYHLAVPMHCFVSGVCSQGRVTPQRLERTAVKLVMPTLLWIFFVKPVIFDSLVDPAATSDHFQSLFQFQSFHGEWYLQALVLWRGSVFLLWSHVHPMKAFVVMMVASCVCGYYNFAPFGSLYLDEIFGYLPFFAFGYVFPLKGLCDHLPRPRPLMSCCVAALVVYWRTVIVKIAFSEPSPPSSGFYGGHHYHNQASFNWDHKLYWTRRVADTSTKVLPVLAIVLLALPRNSTPLTWVGQYTMLPFLLHPLAHIWKSRVVAALGTPDMASTFAHVCVLLAHVPYALTVLLLFSSGPVRWMNSWWYKPSLLSKETDTLPYAAMKSSTAPSDFDIHNKTASIPQNVTENNTECATESSLSIRILKSMKSTISPTIDTTGERWNGKLPTWVGNGRLPWMKDGREYYKLMLPIAICYSAFFFAAVAGPLYIFGDKLLMMFTSIPHWLMYCSFLISLTSVPMSYGYHWLRFRGFFNRVGSSLGGPGISVAYRLTHVVVVVAYREPIEVLLRTFNTIANQKGLARPPIVVLAAEARDDTRHESFAAIQRLCEGKIDRVIMTEHHITQDETRGKSSNENWGVREIHRMLVTEEGMDPFEVMVTIVDADSLLSKTYCAECEMSFFRQPDGRRLVYSGPLNTYRNLRDANLIVQTYEINRCHLDTFHAPTRQLYPQSNYSLTLGLCSELDYWTADNMPEDHHTAVKVSLLNYGGLTTVVLDSFIVNDVVTCTDDRYIQAKRHMWGITEFAWELAILKTMPIPFQIWLQHFLTELKREGSFLQCLYSSHMFILKLATYVAIFKYWHRFPFELRLSIYFSVSSALWSWLWFWVAEVALWRTMLREFAIAGPSPYRWFLLVVLQPIVTILGDFYYSFLPLLDCILHATFIGELAYVCAPKGDAIGALLAKPPGTPSSEHSDCAIAG